ncbi:hypothetical protein OG589_14745 [Sphaerisporangium sp. NBC_01403]|uniref:hypothetical protein n=1 Tax=Sphaerisporangium sp. NBC_01403 TaxID=2903599 RepID=UPI003254B334
MPDFLAALAFLTDPANTRPIAGLALTLGLLLILGVTVYVVAALTPRKRNRRPR